MSIEVVVGKTSESIGPEVGEDVVTPKTADVLAEYSPVHRMIEILAIGTYFSLAAWLAYRLGVTAHGADLWLVGAAAFAGYVAADFVSGLVHWGFDTWGSIYTPVLGANFIRPFREHHFDEKAITRHDFVETNGNNCLASLPMLLGASAVPLHHGEALGVLAVTFVLATCLGVFLTNQAHKWAHADAPPKLVVLLQKWHLVLPPEHHALHHTAPYDTHYCITTGWLNSTLRATRFFRVLERLVTAFTGAAPRRDDLAR